MRSQDARNFYSQEAETKTRLASIRGNNLKAVFKIHHKLYLKKKTNPNWSFWNSSHSPQAWTGEIKKTLPYVHVRQPKIFLIFILISSGLLWRLKFHICYICSLMSCVKSCHFHLNYYWKKQINYKILNSTGNYVYIFSCLFHCYLWIFSSFLLIIQDNTLSSLHTYSQMYGSLLCFPLFSMACKRHN